MIDLICPNCGASASQGLGMSCSDHRPERVIFYPYDQADDIEPPTAAEQGTP